MVEVFDYSKPPFDRVMIATSSDRKRRANQATIEEIATSLGNKVRVDSMNPELFEPESDSRLVDEVAWQKTETLRQNAQFDDGQRTLLIAFDVVTLLGTEEELNAGQGDDLKRILRQINLTGDLDAQANWQHIIDVLEAEQTRMIERCTHGAFCVEWHVGFAINSNDSTIANRGALVLRATFNAINPEIIFQAFALSDDLELLRADGELPDQATLVNGVQALAIGPRLPFAELLPSYGEIDKLRISDRDYKENSAVPANPEEFLRLVTDCALPPHAYLLLFAGSLDPEGTPETQRQKSTVRLVE